MQACHPVAGCPDPAGMAHERTQSGQLIQRAAGYFAQQVTERVQQTAPHESEPNHRQSGGRSMSGDHLHAELTIHLAGPPTRRALGSQSRSAYLSMGHPRQRSRHDTVATQMSAPTEIDAVTKDRQAWIQPAQVLPHSPANQHPACRDAQSLAGLIALSLVDLAWFEL